MYKKACGATAGCTEPEPDRDPIIIRDATKTNFTECDYNDYDIVKAVQYGAIKRVQDLVDAGYDVNQPDNDTVSLLHWAAINNRVEIIKYLLEKNATVDVIGGDLNATPLHWASRQGHLASIVLLIKAGADPEIMDAEGCNCMHLASQFGHTAVVAYYIANNISPDSFDTGGMTALMWSSWKIMSLDPVRLLLTLGANPNLQDLTHGNTAMHWAIMARNPRAIYTLIFKGKANLDISNQRGDTALQLLQQHINSPWIHYEVADRIKDITQRRSNANILMKLTMNQRLRWWTLVILPFVFLFTIGLIISIDTFFILKILILCVFCAIVSIVKRIMLDDNLQSQLPLYFYWASKAFFYVSWAFYISRVVSSFVTLLFIFVNILLWIAFIRLWKGDPGIIKTTHSQRLKTIIELSNMTLEKGKNGFEPTKFCSACLVQKPLRSKHCSVCDHCVGKFDHHCPWIGNDVGVGNHQTFMLFLFLILSVMVLIFYGGVMFYSVECNFTVADGIWNAILTIESCSPWVAWMMINGWFHLLWVSILTTIQIYQIVFIGMTTNERINRGRYRHFMELGGKSPFNLGPWRNLAEFLRCTCCGLLKFKSNNWMAFSNRNDENLIVPDEQLQFV
ncbi:CLUMA_CG011877, isoform A [Clunio marinus]|uniref:Palmitoyltransferase n=1 Tax=Clunio marinus TaxID=568069 RepID=A0A1J1IG59_9DIPT|nr:CLUMA_CG011877, isoform A [Clunio marinus]